MQEYEDEMEYADFAETLERASGARDFVTSLYFDKLFFDELICWEMAGLIDKIKCYSPESQNKNYKHQL